MDIMEPLTRQVTNNTDVVAGLLSLAGLVIMVCGIVGIFKYLMKQMDMDK